MPYVTGGLIVVDSLNSFVNLLLNRYPDTQPRVILNGFCDILKTQLGSITPEDTTIIFTGEYHFNPSMLTDTIRESFYCDVEVVLRPEPIIVPEDYEPTIQTSVGYNLNTLIRQGATSVESRSFCRVIKSRRSMNQSRRCAYDIVPDKGFEFYETYPGDGMITLFAENVKQQYAWTSFFTFDVPESYPALRHVTVPLP